MAFLAWDSDFAFVTDEGAAFHTWTDGYWKLLSLNLLNKGQNYVTRDPK